MMSELYHYGIKGMKWGVRKRRTNDNPISDARWIAKRSGGWNPNHYRGLSTEQNKAAARLTFHGDRGYDVQEKRRRLNSKIKLALTPKRTVAVGKHYLLNKLNAAKYVKSGEKAKHKISQSSRKGF